MKTAMEAPFDWLRNSLNIFFSWKYVVEFYEFLIAISRI